MHLMWDHKGNVVPHQFSMIGKLVIIMFQVFSRTCGNPVYGQKAWIRAGFLFAYVTKLHY